MGRGGDEDLEDLEETKTQAASPEQAILEERAPAMDMDKIWSDFQQMDPNEPDWRLPNDFYKIEAQQLCREVIADYLQIFPGIGPATAAAIIDQLDVEKLEQIDANPDAIRDLEISGIAQKTLDDLADQWTEFREENPAFEMDPVVALQLLTLDYNGDFSLYKKWYKGKLDLIPDPESTCPGMEDAGKALSQAIKAGERIAVFCDYDVDGTTSGEVLRRALEPYGADMHFEYADPQTGFGLTEAFVEKAHREGCRVLVTLDCGSNQTTEIARAKELGMTVIVVDHHGADPENSCDYHLNPHLHRPQSSENTGAQLSWKLGAATQMALDGEIRPEFFQTPVYLAGMGCLADMGSVVLPENRAFLWGARRHAAPGVIALAKALGDDPHTPGHAVYTQAALNLAKRTSDVSGHDIAQILAAPDEKSAAPHVRKLVRKYEAAKQARAEMVQEALAQTGMADRDDDGKITRPDPDKFFTTYTFEDTEYIGYTGPVASKLARVTAKPAVVFARRGTDSQGRAVYKFSTRPDSSVAVKIGDLRTDEDMLAACTVETVSEDGTIREEPSLGGHEQVVSGSCNEENIDSVVEAMESWARRQGRDGSRFYRSPWNGPDAFPRERNVSPERLAEIETQASRLGPFTWSKQISQPRRRGRDDKLASNKEPEISVRGKLLDLVPDEENPDYLRGRLVLVNGESREALFPIDADDSPGDAEVEWLLRIGGSGPYFLRKFARTAPPQK